MSRVIKAADWQEKPLRIATPDPPKAPPMADAEGGFDEEAQQHMLAEIAAKEQRASQLLKDAQVQADILHQQAQDDYDQKLKAAQTEIDTAREKARQAGHDEGWQVGHDEGAQAVRQEMQQQVDEVEGNKLYFLAGGTVVVTATAAESDLYYEATAEKTIVLGKVKATITKNPTAGNTLTYGQAFPRSLSICGQLFHFPRTRGSRVSG